MRKWARRVMFVVGGLAAAGGILFALGLRVVFDGGGGIHFVFTKSAAQQAAEIEKHREAQRAQAPAPAAVQPAPAAAAPTASPTAEKPSTAAVKASAHWTNFRGPDRDGHYRQQPVRTDWGRRAHAAVEATGRRRLRVVRHRRGPGVHDRAARRARTGGGLRRRYGTRAVDERVGCAIPGLDGRRRSARDADVGRRPVVRARRHRRVPGARRRHRPHAVANEHSRRRRRREH